MFIGNAIINIRTLPTFNTDKIIVVILSVLLLLKIASSYKAAWYCPYMSMYPSSGLHYTNIFDWK